MARMIAIGDLARAMAHAGMAPVRDGAAVASIELAIATLAAATPTTDAFWAMRLRYPDPPRRLSPGIALFARWRRARRRRAGVGVAHVLLRWTPTGFDAFVDGQPVARFDPVSSGASPHEHIAADPPS